MSEHTPEKVAELVDELREAVDRESYSGGGYQYVEVAPQDAADAADALTAVSAERDAAAEAVFDLMDVTDRLHKAITEALAGLELSAAPDWPGWNVLTGTENILRAALDQEGDDDE